MKVLIVVKLCRHLRILFAFGYQLDAMERTYPKVTFSVGDTPKDASKEVRSPLRRTMSQYRHIEIFKFGRRSVE